MPLLQWNPGGVVDRPFFPLPCLREREKRGEGSASKKAAQAISLERGERETPATWHSIWRRELPWGRERRNFLEAGEEPIQSHLHLEVELGNRALTDTFAFGLT